MYKRKKPHYKFASVQIELELQQQCQNKVPACVSFFHLCNFTINSLEMRFMSPPNKSWNEKNTKRANRIENEERGKWNATKTKSNDTEHSFLHFILFNLIRRECVGVRWFFILYDIFNHFAAVQKPQCNTPTQQKQQQFELLFSGLPHCRQFFVWCNYIANIGNLTLLNNC